jgi:hypothetical protein
VCVQRDLQAYTSPPPCSVEGLAERTPLLAIAVATVHKTTPLPIGIAVASITSSRLAAALAGGDASRVRLLLRFLASLCAVNVVHAEDIRALFAALLAGAARRPVREGHAIVHAVLAALPWGVNTAGSPLEGAGLGVDVIGAILAAAEEELHALKVPTAEEAAAASLALSRERASDSVFAWHGPLDAPGGGADVGISHEKLALLAAPPARALLALLREALGAGVFASALAVPTIARPQDDVALCALLAAGQAKAAPLKEGEAKAMEEDGVAEVPSAPTSTSAPAAIPLVSWSADNGGAAAWAVARAAGEAEAGSTDWSIQRTAARLNGAVSLPPLPAAGRWYVRHHLTLFGPGGLSGSPAVMTALGLDVPAATPLAMWAVREVAADVAALYAPLHAEAAKALLFLPMGRGRDAVTPFSAAPLAVETVLTQMLVLPSAPATPPYSAVLLLGMLRVDADFRGSTAPASQRPAAVLALAVRVLWKYLPMLDPALPPRLASWLAHHLSNTRFVWPWKEWAACLGKGVPAWDPHRRFMTMLLSDTFAIIGPWHYDRIVAEVLPAEYAASGLLPAKSTTAAYSHLLSRPEATLRPSTPAASIPQMGGDEGGDASAAEADQARRTAPTGPDGDVGGFTAGPATDNATVQGTRVAAAALTTALQAKTSAADIAAWLSSSPEAAGLSAEERCLAFCHALLLYGSANLRNAATLFERYRELLVDGSAWGFVPLEAAAGGVIHASAPHALVRPGTFRSASDMAADVLLASIEAVWWRESNLASAVTGAAVAARVLRPSQVVRHALEPATTLVDRAEEGTAGAGDQLLPALRLSARLLLPRHWSEAHGTLVRAAAAAHSAAVVLACYRGSAVLDSGPRDHPVPEEYEDEAVAKEAGLRAEAVRCKLEYEEAVLAAVECSVRAARALQAHEEVSGPALIGTTAPRRELLRLSLGNLRDVARTHVGVVMGADEALTRILERSTHLLTAARLAHAAAGGAAHVPDLGAAVVHAARAYVPSVHVLPPPSKREGMMPPAAAFD